MDEYGRLRVGLTVMLDMRRSVPASYCDRRPYRWFTSWPVREKKTGENSLSLKTLKSTWGREVLMMESPSWP